MPNTATVYLPLNTFVSVACFTNAARHLNDDGVFVVEAAVPSARSTLG